MGKDFKLGTDPEAVLVVAKTGKIRRPHDIIEDRDPHSDQRPLGANAIGVDGNRETSSIELRPGVSSSGEDLVNRLADLIGLLASHYRPKGIVYRAGAYVDPEPLGGHIHLSWPETKPWTQSYSTTIWRVLETIAGWTEMANYLAPKLFPTAELDARILWARNNHRDFAGPASVRPATLDAAMQKSHIEYRYPPSWLMTPEAAYCFLGGAEQIATETFHNIGVGERIDWPKYVARMFADPGAAPEHGGNLVDALRVASKYSTAVNFVENWT